MVQKGRLFDLYDPSQPVTQVLQLLHAAYCYDYLIIFVIHFLEMQGERSSYTGKQLNNERSTVMVKR